MKWTKKVPSKAGFYWCRVDETDLDQTIVKVSDDCSFAIEFGCDFGFCEFKHYEWAGPIPPPK